MRSLTVDVSDGDVPRIADEILDWVEDIGAFLRQEPADALGK
jgi:hypothetical protein